MSCRTQFMTKSRFCLCTVISNNVLSSCGFNLCHCIIILITFPSNTCIAYPAVLLSASPRINLSLGLLSIHNRFLADMMDYPDLIRSVALVGHLHHGKVRANRIKAQRLPSGTLSISSLLHSFFLTDLLHGYAD